MGEVRHWYKNLLRGRVYFDNRRESIDCLVGDISAQGARIIFSDEVTIPDFIDLNIPQREQTIHACVEWLAMKSAQVLLMPLTPLAHH